MRILGIDEAGRGCVIGPLVIAGVLVDEKGTKELRKLGVLDSKRFSPQKREELLLVIKSIALKITTRIIQSWEIDESNLNLIELENTAHIISELNPDEVYFDVPTHPKGVRSYCKSLSLLVSSSVKLRGENEADKKYPIVGAASIVAKVERDRRIEELKKEYGDFGSGYPSDEKTQGFIKRWYEEKGELPDIVRKKWKSVQRMISPQLRLFG